ncbi:MAG: hypothetical protein JW940_05095 [Polyangiaceae bacterium]|nr:hypothetical protein [Polyangiaceae bacterium]
MTTRKGCWFSSWVAAVLLATAAPAVSEGAEEHALAVVVAKAFPADNLSFGDLKHLYMGNPVYVGGKKLIPVTQPVRASARVAFDQSVLGMSPEAAARYWIDRRIRGQSGPPKAVDPPELLVKVVSKVDGAIGYVRPGVVSGDVKVVRIDGKRPSDPGYRVGR